MPWKSPQPTYTWNEKERTDFTVEIWSRVKFAAFTWAAPPAIPANTQLDITVAEGSVDVDSKVAKGLRIGMDMKITPPNSLPTGTVADAWVANNDELHVRIWNFSAVPVNLPAGQWTFSGVIR